MSMCSVNSYCDNNGEVYMQCLAVIVTITGGGSIGSANRFVTTTGGLCAVLVATVTISRRYVCSANS